MIATDAILLRLVIPDPVAGGTRLEATLDLLVLHAKQQLVNVLARVDMGKKVQIAYDPASRVAYLYAHFAATTWLAATAAAWFESATREEFPLLLEVQASRLQKVFDVAGASCGQLANFHYVVETDANEGWFTELGEWYDQEHMPGLAAVPGCIHAARYLNHDHGPRSHACYTLESTEAKGSPPWMAMTNSAWSSRVRPHFTNTIRTMFQVIHAVKDRSA